MGTERWLFARSLTPAALETVGDDTSKPDIPSILFHPFFTIISDDVMLGSAGSTFCKNRWPLLTRTEGIRGKRTLPDTEVGTQGDERKIRGDICGSEDDVAVSRLLSTGIKKLETMESEVSVNPAT